MSLECDCIYCISFSLKEQHSQPKTTEAVSLKAFALKPNPNAADNSLN